MIDRRWYLDEALAHIRSVVGNDRDALINLLNCLKRGELEARTETWGPKERWRARNIGNGVLSIPPGVWEHPEIGAAGENTVSWPRHWPWPGKVYDPDDDVYGHGVHVSRDDVERLWPGLKEDSTAAVISEQPPRKGIGGVKGEYDWERYLIEAAVHMYNEGIPDSQEKLFNYLWGKYGVKEDGPSAASMKTHIGPLYRRFKQADGN